MKAPVITADGEPRGERALPESLFDGVVHEPAMWQAVKAYLANQRQATASTKGRTDVSGGNKKPWRQKGTGRARQGSIRAAQWRGGGSVFGPRPGRVYHQALPKQVRRLARRSALNARALDGAIRVIDKIDTDTPKTRWARDLLAAAGIVAEQGMNVLLLTDGVKPNVYLSARNLAGVQVRPFGDETTYDVLWSDFLLIEASALDTADAAVEEAAHA